MLLVSSVVAQQFILTSDESVEITRGDTFSGSRYYGVYLDQVLDQHREVMLGVLDQDQDRDRDLVAPEVEAVD